MGLSGYDQTTMLHYVRGLGKTSDQCVMCVSLPYCEESLVETSNKSLSAMRVSLSSCEESLDWTSDKSLSRAFPSLLARRV